MHHMTCNVEFDEASYMYYSDSFNDILLNVRKRVIKNGNFFKGKDISLCLFGTMTVRKIIH